MGGEVWERFVDRSPISVMVRNTLERVLGADPLDLWYECRPTPCCFPRSMTS